MDLVKGCNDLIRTQGLNQSDSVCDHPNIRSIYVIYIYIYKYIFIYRYTYTYPPTPATQGGARQGIILLTLVSHYYRSGRSSSNSRRSKAGLRVACYCEWFRVIFGTKLGGVLLFRVGFEKDVLLLVSCLGGWFMARQDQQQQHQQTPAPASPSPEAAAADAAAIQQQEQQEQQQHQQQEQDAEQPAAVAKIIPFYGFQKLR